jgi:aminoglycoside phosphotransferase (APT) family kinase protein
MPPDGGQHAAPAPETLVRPDIDAGLVERLLAEQFPDWAALPVREVEHQGWDNRTYRLGDELSVRLPSASWYVPAVEKEQRWLPFLAPRLPLPVPEPVGLGQPGGGYPFPWSVRRWLDGTLALHASGIDTVRFGHDVGTFLRRLRSVPAVDGPEAGAHSFHRGAHPSWYAAEVEDALAVLEGSVDVDACRRVWERACATEWDGPPVWFHGDVAPTNLLVDGRGTLSAVIDFGTCGVGDPACDLVLAWTFLDGDARRAFRDAVALPDAVWERARGWVLWKALIMLAGVPAGPGGRDEHERVLAAVLAEPMT